MRCTLRIVGAFVVLILLSASSVSAQIWANPPLPVPFNGAQGQFAGCPKCGIEFALMDWPGPYAVYSQAAGVAFAGWAFECVSGQGIDRAELWYQDAETGYWHQVTANVHSGQIKRPDVAAAPWVVSECPNVGQNTGWWLTATDVPVSGLVRFRVTVWNGAYYRQIDVPAYVRVQ